nr:hypothetical protein [Novosphingobium sp. Chol11]
MGLGLMGLAFARRRRA